MELMEASVVEGRALSPRLRQRQLLLLHDAINQSRESLIGALRQSYGYSTTDANVVVYLVTAAIKQFYDPLDLKTVLKDEYSIAESRDHTLRRIPRGAIWIIPSPSDLLYSAVVPLAAALAGGNCVILEIEPTPSEVASILSKLVSSTLDSDIVTVVNKRPSIATFPPRHIQVLDTKCSERAESSIRELRTSDERSIAVIDRTADIEHAAREIIKARFRFNGQSFYAPDLVLINEFSLKQFASVLGKNALDLIAANVDVGANAAPTKPKVNRDKDVQDQLTGDDVTTLLSNSNGTIVIIHDRSHPLLQRKISQPLLIIHPVTSMDDAIDLVNSRSNGLPYLYQSLYAFASPSSSKYLTQFINSRLAFSNHIPIELLVGPPAPEGVSPTIQPRYTPEMFTLAAPVYAKPSTDSERLTEMLNSTTVGTKSGTNESTVAVVSKLRTKLKPMHEGDGAAIGFFEQGLITGGIVILGSVVTMGVLGWRFLPGLIRSVGNR